MSGVLVIAKLKFIDVERYRKYQAAFPSVFATSGGRVLAADESPIPLSGDDADKVVVMQFPDAETAQAFLTSPEYEEIGEDRDAGAITQSWMVKML